MNVLFFVTLLSTLTLNANSATDRSMTLEIPFEEALLPDGVATSVDADESGVVGG